MCISSRNRSAKRAKRCDLSWEMISLIYIALHVSDSGSHPTSSQLTASSRSTATALPSSFYMAFYMAFELVTVVTMVSWHPDILPYHQARPPEVYSRSSNSRFPVIQVQAPVVPIYVHRHSMIRLADMICSSFVLRESLVAHHGPIDTTSPLLIVYTH